MATLADVGVFYYSKDLTIYDDTDEQDTSENGHELGDTKSFKDVNLN